MINKKKKVIKYYKVNGASFIVYFFQLIHLNSLISVFFFTWILSPIPLNFYKMLCGCHFLVWLILEDCIVSFCVEHYRIKMALYCIQQSKLFWRNPYWTDHGWMLQSRWTDRASYWNSVLLVMIIQWIVWHLCIAQYITRIWIW